MFRSPDKNSIPTEAKEGREPKVEFDWDKHLKAEWEELESSIKELKALNIKGPKGSVDVLKLVGAKKVFLTSAGIEKRGGRIFASGDMQISKLNNLIDLTCLMHEFGHVDQIVNKNFDQKIFKLAVDIRTPEKSNEAKERGEVSKRVVEMFPEVAQIIKSELLDETKAQAIINLPVKIMERDATARALKWFRKISNKTGIDFFKKFKTEDYVFNPAEFDWAEKLEQKLGDCQRSIKEGMVNPDKFMETSVVQELNNALSTYKAKTLTDTYDPGRTGKRIKYKNIKT